MRPVDDAAALIPLVLAVELDGIAGLQRVDATCKVDVVRDQHSMPGRQAHDKALMAAAFVVVREHFGNAATASNLNVAAMIFERPSQCVVVSAAGGTSAGAGSADVIVMLSRKEPALRGEIHGRERNRYGNDPFHCPTQ